MFDVDPEVLAGFIMATKRWSKFVSKDHHKACDCHWYFRKEYDFKYGDVAESARYTVRHFGYVAHDQEFSGDTPEEPLKKTIDFIDEFISKEE